MSLVSCTLHDTIEHPSRENIGLAGAIGFEVGWFSHIKMCIDLMLLLYNTDGGYVIDL